MLDTIIATIKSVLPTDQQLITQQNGTQLVITKQLSNPSFLQMLFSGGAKQKYQLVIQFDETQKTATMVEQETNVKSGGLLSFGGQMQTTKGGIVQKESGAQYGAKTDGTVGQVYAVSFDASAIKSPVKTSLEQNGWRVIDSIL